MTDLTDHLLAQGPNLDDPANRERWICDSDEKANWCLRKLAGISHERDRLKAQAAREVARVEAALEDALRPLDHDAAFFTGQLNGYRDQLEQDHPDLPKTYKLANGALLRRAGRASTYIADEAAFTAWAKDNCPDALKVSPKVTPLKDYPRVTTDDGTVVLRDPDTGHIVPGVSVVTAPDRYEVQVAADLIDPSGDPF